MSIIEIKNITMDYGNTVALKDISFKLEANKIYGLLGRNGAGKTTLLNIITNRIFPTSGEIIIEGELAIENDRALNKIFYVTEKNLYPDSFKVKEAFLWTKEFYNQFDMDYALKLSNKFGLNIKKKIKGLSTGYFSIFKAITALASKANIIIFDEPVLGLDANHRNMFYKELIANYSENPKTIIVSTHLIEEVETILEDVIIIKNGSLVVKSSVDELLASSYTVSGEAAKVDEYVKNRRFIDGETIGRFKAATVIESINNKDEALASQLSLEFSKVELQELFISLTNS